MTPRCRTIPLLVLLGISPLAGCDGSLDEPEPSEESAGDERVWPDDSSRCPAEGPTRDVMEYDTSGDDHPDVRKVFAIVGDGLGARMVLICREADLNGDGIKDIVRYYNDEGDALREEADRNFDGNIDSITHFEHEGVVSRRELDEDYDGRVDTKTYYQHGQPLRTERDSAGRSTAYHWSPDRWEYYEGGRVVRVGSDLDGDGRVDRWDRNSRPTGGGLAGDEPRPRAIDSGETDREDGAE